LNQQLVYENVHTITSLPVKRIKRYYSNQPFSEVYPQNGGENQPERNYVTATLCIVSAHPIGRRVLAAVIELWDSCDACGVSGCEI